MSSLKKGISTVLLSSVLFACGSGGGGGSSSGGGFVNPATCVLPSNVVAITSANAELIASEVVSAIQGVIAFANLDSSFIDLLGTPIVTNPATAPCDMSGSLTVTITDNDMSSTISVNDLISSTFANCVLMPGTVNGLVDATINSTTGANVGSASSIVNWTFSTNGNLNNLNINDSNINAAVSGDTTEVVSFNAAAAQLTSTVTNMMLNLSDNTGQCASVQGAVITSTVTNPVNIPATYTVNVNPAGALLVASTSFSGVVTAETPATPFSGMEALDDDADGEIDEYFAEIDSPDAGVLVITGFMSTATVNIIANNIVRIDVDVDGDNMVDDMIMTSWDAL